MGASKRDLAGNAVHWLEQAKRNHLGDQGVGCIFIFFNKDERGSAVCTANVHKEAVKAHLKDVLKQLGDGNLIVSPWSKQ